METVDIIIEMENGDVMKGELYPEVAPITVENFLKLIDEDFFAGLIFHRIIPGFMIQGGGYDVNFNEKHTDAIKGEFRSNGVDNDLKHTPGVLSMARTMFKDSASSQFFIMHEAAPHLDGDYAAFGKITEGLDVVDKIARAPRDMRDCPNTPIVIKTIKRA
ncbi:MULTISPECIES: peptidylprolyl isomerase [Coprobacillaceae]|uniref:peptidylprolyl isomerase n=1 Tax=Coprobacillaceae TaxID=2810280 RepID=UPI000E515366|nr:MULTISPECIES: peptidylprolyl isomerase [Coprobacillaceae]RHM59946.1 peptidylprolyl isomerase [Coprobacillus sp. AF33-1AC]RHS92283.1 peptidylprolyl isomerase [Erysipelatoclostridium sp. AM42-17]